MMKPKESWISESGSGWFMVYSLDFLGGSVLQLGVEKDVDFLLADLRFSGFRYMGPKKSLDPETNLLFGFWWIMGCLFQK